MKLAYRPDIDGLRAIAVGSVLIYHVDSSILPGGFLGVDIFFVISGYLISLILLKELAQDSFSFMNFYVRRICRLFPALLVVLFTVLVFGYFALFADEYERLALHSSYVVAFVINFLLMDEVGYFDLAADVKPLLHLWSLAVEEQFYLLWPLALFGFRKRFSNIGVIVIFLMLISYALTISSLAKTPEALYYHPVSRFWQLLMGGLVAIYHFKFGEGLVSRRSNSVFSRALISLLALGFIFFPLFSFDISTSHPNALTILPLIGVVMILTLPQAMVNRLLALKPLVFVGLISYPLYLWHWPLLSYVRIIESGKPDAWIIWSFAGLSVLLAWLTWEFIEKPLQKTNKNKRAIYLLLSMFVILVFSLTIYLNKGFVDRESLLYIKNAKVQMQREPKNNQACLDLFEVDVAPWYCRLIGGENSEWIAVIGDSHADALFFGVAEAAAKLGFGSLLLANSGCPPLMGTVAGREPSRSRCPDEINNVLSSVAAFDKVKKVIISTRGPLYITGTGFGPAELGKDSKPIAFNVYSDGSQPSEIFAVGLQSTVRFLAREGKIAYYMLQVPEVGVDIASCIGRPLILSSQISCDVSYLDYRERMRNYRMAVEAAKGDGLFQVIDPELLFCDVHLCTAFFNSSLLYADDDHLSRNGSKLIAPIVMKAIGID